MMDEYRSLAVFVAVHAAGSFSAAGRRLKLSTSVVSHHVSKLESKLGASVFFRSTRALSLTPEGQKILPYARAMVDAGEQALDSLSDSQTQPTGSLRITMPAFGERSALNRAIWRFAKDFPQISVSLHTSDTPVDLVKEGYDLAIRLGVLRDSTLKSTRIGSFGRVLVASPAYLATRPPILELEDLRGCDFISIAMLPDAITLVRQGEEVHFEPDTMRLEVHSLASAKSAILEGLGIQHLPESEAQAEIAEGTLIEVLPDWSMPRLGAYAVWPDIGPQKKLTRRLIDFLKEDRASD